MRTIKIIGYAGIASVALAFSTNSLTQAETQLAHDLSFSAVEKTKNVVHRVNHSLASSQHYSGNLPSGYKWGQDSQESNAAATWVDSVDAQGGSKWGSTNTAEQSGSKWGRSNTAEQSGSKWGRSSTAEQAGSKWGRS